MTERAAQTLDRLHGVMRYHTETKHDFARYARAPGSMDWANQPDPFRRYEGSPFISLPRLAHQEAPHSPPYEDLYRRGGIASAPVTVRTISRFLEYSLAISAWKQAGEIRWALRANPSSGNLHPTEGYLLVGELPDLATGAGLHHYRANDHALELRARWSGESLAPLLQRFPPRAFLFGLASVNWRETWKYGERAFRYCQHDAGHAIGGARIAARTLGWRMLLLDGLADDAVAALLGVDRAQDFKGAEPEHPDCLAVVWPDDARDSESASTTTSIPLFVDADAVRACARQTWYGHANRLSRDDPVRWQFLDEVEGDSWKSSSEPRVVELRGARTPIDSHDHVRGIYPGDPQAGQVIRQRRSALAFDGRTSIPFESFFTMLARVMPRSERSLGERPMPWDALPWEPAIHLALFVHRVDGIAPGLYLLARDPAKVGSLRQAMHKRFAWVAPAGCPGDLPLFMLEEGDARQLATQVSCRQDIAGEGAFSLGMIAEFEGSLRRHGPWFYRRLFWETGVIGQVLYLEAEAHGVRATGIGCFFDDPVHRVFGFDDETYQSLYHFTIGGHVEDTRLTTLPPYG